MNKEETLHITIDLPIKLSNLLGEDAKNSNRSKRQQLKEIVRVYYEYIKNENMTIINNKKG